LLHVEQRRHPRHQVLAEPGRGRDEVRVLGSKRNDERGEILGEPARVLRRIAMEDLLHSGELPRSLRRSAALVAGYQHGDIAAHLARRGHRVGGAGLQLLSVVFSND
jgi:hypothetical protein